MKKRALWLIWQMQKGLLWLSYYLCRVFVNCRPGLWIVGVEEIIGYIQTLGRMLPLARTVCFIPDKYYDMEYDYSVYKAKQLQFVQLFVIKALYGPLLLGYLANKAESFLYIWSAGFLVDSVDGRAYEFSFLKKRNKRICCIFVGSDIRSPQLAVENAKKLGLDIYANYYKYFVPQRMTAEYERRKKALAWSADNFADIVFNAPVDQISYLSREVYPFFYFCKEALFCRNEDKFRHVDRYVIMHAPSSPIPKGTQLVRAAVKKLQMEGYRFEYVELIHVPNTQVITYLQKAHIVLNEFYSFVPGVFGIEAMASHCALLTSADPKIETFLPAGAEQAWVLTKYWQVYDQLRWLLDHPEEIKQYADRGFDWTWENYSYAKARDLFIQALHKEKLI